MLCIGADAASKRLGFDMLASLSLEVGDEAIVEPLQAVLAGKIYFTERNLFL